WMLRRADRVVASGPSEADRLRRAGVREGQIAVIPPGVAVPPTQTPDVREIRRGLGLPEGARVVLAAGPFERYKGGYEAVWAFDIVSQLFDNLHLVLAGGGGELPRLRRFAAELRGGRRVRFTGPVPDVAGLLSVA